MSRDEATLDWVEEVVGEPYADACEVYGHVGQWTHAEVKRTLDGFEFVWDAVVRRCTRCGLWEQKLAPEELYEDAGWFTPAVDEWVHEMQIAEVQRCMP